MRNLRNEVRRIVQEELGRRGSRMLNEAFYEEYGYYLNLTIMSKGRKSEILISDDTAAGFYEYYVDRMRDIPYTDIIDWRFSKKGFDEFDNATILMSKRNRGKNSVDAFEQLTDLMKKIKYDDANN